MTGGSVTGVWAERAWDPAPGGRSDCGYQREHQRPRNPHPGPGCPSEKCRSGRTVNPDESRGKSVWKIILFAGETRPPSTVLSGRDFCPGHCLCAVSPAGGCQCVCRGLSVKGFCLSIFPRGWRPWNAPRPPGLPCPPAAPLHLGFGGQLCVQLRSLCLSPTTCTCTKFDLKSQFWN